MSLSHEDNYIWVLWISLVNLQTRASFEDSWYTILNRISVFVFQSNDKKAFIVGN